MSIENRLPFLPEPEPHFHDLSREEGKFVHEQFFRILDQFKLILRQTGTADMDLEMWDINENFVNLFLRAAYSKEVDDRKRHDQICKDIERKGDGRSIPEFRSDYYHMGDTGWRCVLWNQETELEQEVIMARMASGNWIELTQDHISLYSAAEFDDLANDLERHKRAIARIERDEFYNESRIYTTKNDLNVTPGAITSTKTESVYDFDLKTHDFSIQVQRIDTVLQESNPEGDVTSATTIELHKNEYPGVEITNEYQLASLSGETTTFWAKWTGELVDEDTPKLEVATVRFLEGRLTTDEGEHLFFDAYIEGHEYDDHPPQSGGIRRYEARDAYGIQVTFVVDEDYVITNVMVKV